ncbi:MAG: hypothetical protein NT113_05735 [Hyphomicrobiales bacterium]|nr:hypothetical protein [Hyphomicrobiales bacterium]
MAEADFTEAFFSDEAVFNAAAAFDEAFLAAPDFEMPDFEATDFEVPDLDDEVAR